MKRPSTEIILLCAFAALTAILGGQLSTGRQGLEPGFVPLLKALAGGFEAPFLTHALLLILPVSAICISLFKRRIVHVPRARLGVAAAAFFATMLISVGMARFQLVAASYSVEWVLIGVTFFAAVAVLGRREGPIALVGSLATGCTMVAIIGIREYAQMRAIDPNYRIHAGWIEPNAAAGILGIGVLLLLGLSLRPDRRVRLASGLGAALCLLALFLTGSRGGLLAIFVGGVATLAYALIAKAKFQRLVPAFVSLAVGIVLIGLSIAANKAQVKSGPVDNRNLSVSVADNSSQFRKLLWQGTAQLIRENPFGLGLGNYRFFSAKPKLTTQTFNPHQSYLHLWVEAGPISLIAFLVLIGYWLRSTLQGLRAMDEESLGVRAGVFGAVIMTLAHGLFESNIVFFGIGSVFFLLLAAGLLLSTDGVALELAQRFVRGTAAVIGFCFLALALVVGIQEVLRSRAQFEALQGNRSEARALASSAVGISALDGDALGLLANLSDTPEERLRLAIEASKVTPSTAAMRRLADAYATLGKNDEAANALRHALTLDPYNLPTNLRLLRNAISRADREEATEVAREMVKIESSPYFTVRALGEVVPTETCEARLYLAEQTPDPAQKLDLLAGAMDIYMKYAQVAVPPIVRFKSEGGYAEETPEMAIKKMEKAKELATTLKQTPPQGRAADVARFEEAVDKALSDLRK
jgi:O-antigen ligase